ncbi:MAG: hypothetical protein ACOC3C_07700, partial [Candidatus Thorarchaeota archaeon]
HSIYLNFSVEWGSVEKVDGIVVRSSNELSIRYSHARILTIRNNNMNHSDMLVCLFTQGRRLVICYMNTQVQILEFVKHTEDSSLRVTGIGEYQLVQ